MIVNRDWDPATNQRMSTKANNAMLAIDADTVDVKDRFFGTAWEWPDGEHKLMAAILEDAVDRLEGAQIYTTFRAKREFEAAERWIMTKQKWLFSFTSICEALEIDAGAAQVALIKRFGLKPRLTLQPRPVEVRKAIPADNHDRHWRFHKNCQPCAERSKQKLADRRAQSLARTHRWRAAKARGPQPTARVCKHCQRPAVAKGVCQMVYSRAWRQNDRKVPTPEQINEAARSCPPWPCAPGERKQNEGTIAL